MRGPQPRDNLDRDAEFRVFVAARWAALTRYAYLFTADHGHAEDLVQQALEQCWRRWGKVRVDAPEAYVRAAIANAAAAGWRRRRVRESPLESAPAGREPTCPDPAAALVERNELWQAVQSLPPRMRAVVVLRLWEDLSEQQTARVLGCSTGAVKSHLSRALSRLRDRHGQQTSVPPASLGTIDRMGASS